MNKNGTPFQIKTCEMHSCGEPVRIIENIEPPIPYPQGSTILEKKRFLAENYDFVRKMTIFEPRGHRDMFGVIMTDPNANSTSDLGLIFFNNEGYLSMCGHITIAIGRYLLEKRIIIPSIPETEVVLDCPCGVIKVSIEWDGHKVGNTKFINVPSFVQCFDYEIYVPEMERPIICDIAFAGNFFAIVTDKNLGVDFNCDKLSNILDSTTFLLKALRSKTDVKHRSNKNFKDLCAVLVTDRKETNDPIKILCGFGKNSFDRSPCGSGTSAILACEYFRGNLKLNEKKRTQNPFLNENCYFQGIPIEEVDLKSEEENMKGVRIEITGRAYFTGETLMTFEEDDHLKFGFLV